MEGGSTSLPFESCASATAFTATQASAYKDNCERIEVQSTLTVESPASRTNKHI